MGFSDFWFFYLSKDSLFALVHRKDLDGALFLSSFPFPPLYVESPVVELEYCFCFLSFWTFCFFTSSILSLDRRVRFSSAFNKAVVFSGFVFCDSSRIPEYPAFWMILARPSFASNWFDSILIGSPDIKSQGQFKVKSGSN